MLFISRKLKHMATPIGLILILISIPIATTLGSTDVSFKDMLQTFFEQWELLLGNTQPQQKETLSPKSLIIWELRLPRIIMACLCGAGLALAGITLQTITQNRMADPHLLGISSGAVLGAVIATLHIGEVLGVYTLPIAAFSGSLIAAVLIAFLYQKTPMRNGTQLLMSGVALSFIFMSTANLALFLGDHRTGHQVIFWMLGGLGASRWSYLLIPFVVCIASFIYLKLHAKQLNALLLGDETAKSLGIHVERFRLILFIISALITSSLVAHTGAIGFVGLMIPHIGRYLIGGNLKDLLPFTAILGGLFLIWIDVLTRLLISPEELPIGIITGLIGGAFFIVLLIRSGR